MVSISAIVTDAKYRMALAAIRSLGRAGVPVTAAEDAPAGSTHVLGFHSRYASGTATITSARENPAQFIRDLLQLAPGHRAVIPVTLSSILAVAEHREEVNRVLGTAVASPESIRVANDTNTLLPLAARVGVPIPVTTTMHEGERVEDLADRIPYPVVIKYRAGEELFLPPEQRYAIVQNREVFINTFTAMHRRQSYPLVQEYVPGAGFGVSAVFDHRHQPVALFQHKRLREYPVTGGPSCFCESVHIPRLTELAMKLLKELNWVGVAMVEFKQDAAGDFRLMEINPRFWGSIPLALAAGVPIPLLLYQVAVGENITPVTTYRTGVRLRYLFQDLLSVPGYLKRREDKMTFLFGFSLNLLDPRVKDGVFAMDDPRPGLVYALRSVDKVLRRQKGED